MMAIKRTVKELCERCGQKQARLTEDGRFLWVGHNCPEAPPGPPSPPRKYRIDEVIWEPVKVREGEA